MVSSSTTEWLTQRPTWLQVAVKRLLEYGDLNDAAISDPAVLCQQEGNNEFPDIDCSIPSGAFDTHDSEEIGCQNSIITDGQFSVDVSTSRCAVTWYPGR